MLLQHDLKDVLTTYITRILLEPFLMTSPLSSSLLISVPCIIFNKHLPLLSLSYIVFHYIFFPCDFVYGTVYISLTHPFCILSLYLIFYIFFTLLLLLPSLQRVILQGAVEPACYFGRQCCV